VIYTSFALVIDSSRSFTSFAINDRMICSRMKSASSKKNTGIIKHWYYKKTIKLEDMDPLRIKEETKNYTVEKMDASYNEICKGVMDNDAAYLW